MIMDEIHLLIEVIPLESGRIVAHDILAVGPESEPVLEFFEAVKVNWGKDYRIYKLVESQMQPETFAVYLREGGEITDYEVWSKDHKKRQWDDNFPDFRFKRRFLHVAVPAGVNTGDFYRFIVEEYNYSAAGLFE